MAYSTLNYIQAALSFAISLVLARRLEAEIYGYYTYGMVFNSTFYILIQYGLDKTLVRDLVQRSKKATTILFTGTLIKIGITLFGILLLATWSLFFSDTPLLKVYLALLFGLSGGIFGIGPRAWFDYMGKMQLHAYLMLIERIVFFGCTMVLIFYYPSEQIVLQIGWILLGGRLLMGLMEWSFIRKSIGKFNWLAVKATFRPILFKNSWVWLAAINNLLMTNANQLILDQEMGTVQLGYYGLAFQLIMLVQLMQGQLLRLATPSIAQAVKEVKGWKILKKYRVDLLRCLGLTLLVLIPIYFVAPYLIEFLVGKDYAGALPILQVLCFWSIIYGLAIINNQYLLSYHLQKPFFFITLIFGIISIFLVYTFLPLFGGKGAALSLLVAHFGSVFVQSIFVFQKMRKNAKDFERLKNKVLSKETKVGTA